MTKDVQGILAERLPFFGELTDAQRTRLLAGSSFTTYPAGVHIYGGEMECAGVLLVLSGTLRVYLLSDQGRDITLYRVGAGDTCLLSATCVLRYITFAAHVDALDTVETVQISAATFSALQAENIYVENYALRLSARRFSEVMWTMQQVLFLGVDVRIARYLLRQDDLLRQTHEEIARDTGTAREVVSRMLRRFSDEGLVQLQRGSVRILDRAGLKALAAE